MGLLEDCADFVNLMSAGKALFRHGSAAEAINGRLLDLINGTAVPARGTTLFVSTQDIRSQELRNYLHGEVDRGLDLTVTVYDPQTFDLVNDFGVLDQARTAFGVGVNLPPGLAVPAEALSEVMKVDGDGLRLNPQSMVAQRGALALLIDDPATPSPAKLKAWLVKAPPGLDGDRRWTGDRSALLGVPYALVGDRPGHSLAKILASHRPLSQADLGQHYGGSFGSVDLDTVRAELGSGRALAALVHGWSPGQTEPERHWLFRDEDGMLRWATEQLPAYNPDGAADPQTRLLEQPHTTVLMLGSDGAAYQPVPPVLPFEPSPTRLHLTVNTRMVDNAILLGPWHEDGLSATDHELMALASTVPGDKVLLKPRRDRPVDRLSTLDPSLSSALHYTLESNPQLPVVLASESNDESIWKITQQHGRSSVQPVVEGFRKIWDVMGPASTQRYRYDNLNSEVWQQAMNLSQPPATIGPAELRSLTASRSWPEAVAYYRDNIGTLRTPEMAGAAHEMVRAQVARGLLPDPYGTGAIKDSRFYTPNVTLPAFATILDTALRARNDPTLAGKASIAPQTPWITDPIPPHTQTADENLLFDYLTDRPLSLAAATVGPYTTALLWHGVLFTAAVKWSEATGLTPAETLTVIKAKGELYDERAARIPSQPEQLRAFAIISEYLIGLTHPDQIAGKAADLKNLLTAIDCLPGEARVSLLYLVKNEISPSWAHLNPELDKFGDYIGHCTSVSRKGV